MKFGYFKKRKRKKVSREELKYGEWLRTQRCLCCGWMWPIEAAHTGGMKHGAGWGRKSDHERRIPLCDRCHRDGPRSYHAVGSEPKWCDIHQINLDESVDRLRAAYAEAKGTSRPQPDRKGTEGPESIVTEATDG